MIFTNQPDGLAGASADAKATTNALFRIDLVSLFPFFDGLHLATCFGADPATETFFRIDLGVIMGIDHFGGRDAQFIDGP